MKGKNNTVYATQICICALIVHLLLLILFVVYVKGTSTDFPFPSFAVLIPVFGPITAIMAVHRELKGRDYTELIAFIKSGRNELFDYDQSDTSEVVAAEEMLFQDSFAERRSTMLNVLSQDVREYLDVLLLALSNEDIEVVHYATANIMQIQNEFQDGLSQLSVAMHSDEATEENARDYVKLLNDYIESGLITGVLVHRQRVSLSEALKLAVDKFGCRDLLAMQLHNLIELEDFSVAYELVNKEKEKSIEDEDLINEIMNYYVTVKDGTSLQNYLKYVTESTKDIGRDLREVISYWQTEALTPCITVDASEMV